MNDKFMEDMAATLLPYLQQEQGRKGIGYKHDSPATPSAAGYMHGPGGLLSFPGVDPTVFSAMIGPKSIIGQLPVMPSLYAQPTYWTLTGVQAETGSEATANCGASPVAGLAKACLTVSVFGKYKRQTSEVELNRMGKQVDRADPMDLTLVGSPIHGTGLFTQGVGNPEAPGDVLVNEMSIRMWELGVAFHRLLSREIWTGNPANTGTAIGSKKQMTGLATLINTGYVDAETNQACAAVDSYVRSFGSQNISTTPGSSNIVAAITDMYHQLKDRAMGAGLDPVRWVIAMRPQLFYELTAIWPCSYLSFRCNLSGTSATEFIDAQDAVRFRDEMRAGQYLLIDGERLQVVLDSGIPEVDGNEGAIPRGCFNTDIYFIPMSVVGGRAVTFLEYFQFQNPSISDALGNMVLGKVDGPWLIVPVQTRQCFQLEAKIEPRLVVRTPWLAGRLQNVQYCPIQHERDPFPEDPYFVNGGRTNRVAQGPSFYSLWGGTTGQ